MQNYYNLLKINRDASPSEIKKACNRKLAIYHPDKLLNYLSQFPPSEQSFQQNIFKQKYELISFISNILNDPEKKQQYDLSLNLKDDTHNKLKTQFNNTVDTLFYVTPTDMNDPNQNALSTMQTFTSMNTIYNQCSDIKFKPSWLSDKTKDDYIVERELKTVDDYILERESELLSIESEQKQIPLPSIITKNDDNTKTISYEELIKQREYDDNHNVYKIEIDKPVLPDDFYTRCNNNSLFIEPENITKLLIESNYSL